MTTTTIDSPTQQQREALLRRAAAGEELTAGIIAIDAQIDADRRTASLSAEVEGTRQAIAAEEAQASIQRQYEEAVAHFRAEAGLVNEAAERVEKLLADARAALQAWKAEVDKSQTNLHKAHALTHQGATRARDLPDMPVTRNIEIFVGHEFAGDYRKIDILPRAKVHGS